MGKHIAVKIILGLLLINVFILTGIERVAFNDTFYIKSFEKYDIPKETNMDMEKLLLMKEDLFSYLDGSAQSLSPLYFTDSDRLHMVDVRDLFQQGRSLRNWSLAIIPLILIFIFACEGLRGILKTLKWTAGISIISIVGIILLALINFNKAFTYFHLIFFDNDLWIMDPVKDMVRYFPEDFFLDSAIYAITFGILCLISIVVIMAIAERYLNKNLKQKG